jgi:heme-degrading monooxygenase HmoA
MIARVWHGRTPAAKADDYAVLLQRTGLADYRAIPGNRGVFALRRLDGTEAEFLLISFWESFESIRRFAGPDAEKAFYYPEDDSFLIEKEPRVAHFQVFAEVSPVNAED